MLLFWIRIARDFDRIKQEPALGFGNGELKIRGSRETAKRRPEKRGTINFEHYVNSCPRLL